MKLCRRGYSLEITDRVSTRQVDANSSTPRGQDEAKDPGIVVESIHEPLSLLDTRGPIQTEVGPAVFKEKLILDCENREPQ